MFAENALFITMIPRVVNDRPSMPGRYYDFHRFPTVPHVERFPQTPGSAGRFAVSNPGGLGNIIPPLLILEVMDS